MGISASKYRDILEKHGGMPVKRDRLWQSVLDLAKIGGTDHGGVTRLTLTKEAGLARDLVISWCRSEGCSITIDQIGNIFARRAGKNPELSAIGMGSHIDTQPKGGKFDGNYGVLAALEVIRTLNEYHIKTEAPLELCVWTNEEGSRFTPTMMGSAVYTGDLSLEDALAKTDGDGIKAGDALKDIGYNGTEVASLKGGARRLGAYFEAHIEQGPLLDKRGIEIGIVTGALGQCWYDVEITGVANHAGTTPMDMRKDPMQAAADLIQRVIALSTSRGENGRGTIGHMRVFPNARNVIPAEVKLTIDLRHSNSVDLRALNTELHAIVDVVAKQYDISISVNQVVDFDPPIFDQAMVSLVRSAVQDLGYSHMEMVSGAGHDAVQLANTLPVAMIFIPSKDGISHNEAEYSSPIQLEMGANVLLRAVLAKSL